MRSLHWQSQPPSSMRTPKAHSSAELFPGPASRDPRERNSTLPAFSIATNFRLVGSIDERNRYFFFQDTISFWSAAIASHCAGK
ncbi:hypothetical protein CEXT_233751 [Caerostris extrusa]|uniref:Uncharacterized protein n=1 Tax=Caerostris extrusa TaxID=172846 RepID=A0AAV4VYL3_CAEEX|nr:hypothetical protein CEXT_233751 [Caerostris extrusa]